MIDPRFTPEETATLCASAYVAGFVVTAADPSGIVGLVKEAAASAAALREAHSSSSGLVRAVATEALTEEGRAALRERLAGTGLSDGREAALAVLRDAATIVDRGAPAEAEAFKRWLLDVARDAAGAAREGGFLGFGGVAVSDAEARILADVAAALGIAG